MANREKYNKLVKRRKGAVQEMREAAPDGATYEGEATGVRTHLRKSLRLSWGPATKKLPISFTRSQ